MSRIRTVFLGTPDIAAHCLKRLIDDEHFEVVGCVSQPDRPAGRNMKTAATPVKAVALREGIPLLQVERLNQNENLDQLKAWNAECAVVVAFGQILSQKFLDLYPRRVVNVHASLLPRWRGAAPIQRALIAGDCETGVALQVMIKKLDAGSVLGFRKIQIMPDMTAIELHEQLKPLAADLLHIELMDYMRGHLVPVMQDEKLVTYAPKISKAEGLIDWCLPAKTIDCLVRGMTLGPGTWTFRQGQRLKILKTQPQTAIDSTLSCGSISAVTESSFFVACGAATVLKILCVQPESKPQMMVADYLRGYPMKVGEQLQNEA